MSITGSADLARSPLDWARASVAAFLLVGVTAGHLAAETRFIVRTQEGLNGVLTVTSLCAVVGCTVRYPLDGGMKQVFLVTTATSVDPTRFLTLVTRTLGIADAEVDGVVRTQGGARAAAPPAALFDAAPVAYYGATVWNGYVDQPASRIVRAALAQSEFALTGRGVIVAVIDTGVDGSHPALGGSVVQGYDFTRNADGGSERPDAGGSGIVRDRARPMAVNESTMAVVDESTMAVVDNPEHAAFGHGTMVAGLIHLVAPRATILPLKAFNADGTAYSSDVLRSIYFAVRHGAKVLSMSFSYVDASRELDRAITFASKQGLVAVSSVGNDGRRTLVYPAALNDVVGVASTTNDDTLSSFSNYGADLAWIAAPGEGVVTTYPFGSYAAGWGTSFSAPFASGTAALLVELDSATNQHKAADALGAAIWFSPEVAHGRLDLPYAIMRRRSAGGS